jgi:CheY-like chemotaxis protein
MSDRRETVLLVGDEALLRMAAADLLDDAGFTVVEAASADETLRVLETDPDAVHVLVTDVHMPGSMDGLGLAAEVDRRWPHVRLIVTSGLARYSDQDIPDSVRFVPKSWHLAAMVGAIHAAGRS